MFYSIEKIISSQVGNDIGDTCLFKARLQLSLKKTIIFRKAYDINDLLGNLGGVVRVLMTVFGVIFYPIS